MQRRYRRARFSLALELRSFVPHYSHLSWCKNSVTASSVTGGGSVIVIIAGGSCSFNPVKPHWYDSLQRWSKKPRKLWGCSVNSLSSDWLHLDQLSRNINCLRKITFIWRQTFISETKLSQWTSYWASKPVNKLRSQSVRLSLGQ